MSKATVDEIFIERCLGAQFADSTAVIVEDGSRKVSYQELNGRVDILADAISSRLMEDCKFDPECDVGMISILIDRDIGMIVAILAIIRAGAAYIPIDPNFPLERQQYILQHSNSKIVITDGKTYQNAKSLGFQFPTAIIINPETGYISDVWKFSIKSSHKSSRNKLDLLYVLYTSGSTGKPKGVMVTNKGVLNTLNHFAKELCIKSSHKVLNLTTYCFDISVLEIFLPLLNGATLVIASSATQKDPYRLIDVLKDRHIDIMQATPTTYEMMLATGWTGNSSIDFLVGGEAFRPALLPLTANCKSLHNVYGPTETTIWSCSYKFPNAIVPTSAIAVPIGKPISETTFYLLNVDESFSSSSYNSNDHKFILSNSEGELLIGGAGVALGYLHAPELTAQKFIRNPFVKTEDIIVGNDSNDDDILLYRTGDFVKRLEDGNYVFVRRLDDQVKVNGYRIELGEIENVLEACVLVKQAVVIVRDNQLLAYVTLLEKSLSATDLTTREILSHASKYLTTYMVPKAVVILESFPHTANGKLDRNALPDPLSPTITSNITDITVHSIDSPPTRLISEGLTGSRPTLVTHVCNLLEQLRGYRPLPTATFASVGVDSLGAVMFVRNLSVSLQAIRIPQKDLYLPGVTILSFCVNLQARLLIEKPELLSHLGLFEILSIEDKNDLENGDNNNNNNNNRQSNGDTVTMGFESFEDNLVYNQKVLEGLRGMFIIMVYYDRFRGCGPLNIPNLSIRADTAMFVLISGFTTALQLRVPRVADCKGEYVESFTTSKAWNWISFIISRAVGLFPLLWVCLLLHIPRWKNYNRYISATMGIEDSARNEGLCSFLYVIAGQLYIQPTCVQLGPDYSLGYASQIWNCFLIYAVSRIIFNWIQKHVLLWCSQWDKNILATTLASIWANRPSTSTCCWIFIFWSLLNIALTFAAKSISTNPVGFPVNFMIRFYQGTMAAALYESIYWVLYEQPNAILSSITETDTATNSRMYTRIKEPGESTSTSGISSKSSTSLMNTEPSTGLPASMMRTKNTLNHFYKIIGIFSRLFLRFFPDILVGFMAILLSPLTPPGYGLGGFEMYFQMQNTVLPITALILILAYLFQLPNQRTCITRVILESPLFVMIGHCSFPNYLLMKVMLNFYFRLIIVGGGLPSNPDDPAYYNDWYFSCELPEWYKLPGLVIMIAISWILQRIFQDELVTRVFSYCMYYRSKNRTL